MKEELKIKVQEVINLLDMLLSKERFGAYRTIQKRYTVFLKTIDKKHKIEEDDFIVIMDCMRIFLEAPPNDSKLDAEILNKMDEITMISNQIISEVEK